MDLIEVKHLTKAFPITGGLLGREIASVKAVSDVSFTIKRGETLGLVGESGCGKSTLGRCLLRLYEASAGEIFFEGKDIAKLSQEELFSYRKKMQIIFQDPYASLDPRMNVERILSEPMNIHKLYMGTLRQKRLQSLLDYVQLPNDALLKYPHEFSGGQRQRICIARALAVDPSFIVCDEPVSALDVSIQAQIINLLEELQKELGLTYLFIAHDLKVVEYISNRVAVMYLGKIVEQATVAELYKNPKHPYTQALFSAIPLPDPDAKTSKSRVILQGDIPSPINPPAGCHFNPRCFRKIDKCTQSYPETLTLDQDHCYRCFNPSV